MSETDHTNRLNRAVERIYRTFEQYTLCTHIVGCPCCVDILDQETIRAKTLRNLSEEDLKKYVFKAMSTWGTVEDWKHFLPRVLELLATGRMDPHVDSEVIIGKLDYAGWQDWPALEREALTDFLMALWQAVLSSYPCFLHPEDQEDDHGYCIGNADKCLCSIGKTVGELSPFLDVWTKDPSMSAIRHLAKFISENADTLGKRRALSNPFWRSRDAQMRQVVDWLSSPLRYTTLEEAYFRNSNEPVASEFSTAVDQLHQFF